MIHPLRRRGPLALLALAGLFGCCLVLDAGQGQPPKDTKEPAKEPPKEPAKEPAKGRILVTPPTERPDLATEERAFAIRHNVDQEVFIWVQNQGTAKTSFNVEMLINGRSAGIWPVEVDTTAPAHVTWKASADKPPAPVEKVDSLVLRLLDSGNKPIDGTTYQLNFRRPSAFLTGSLRFRPTGKDLNNLIAEIRPRVAISPPDFALDLVLDPRPGVTLASRAGTRNRLPTPAGPDSPAVTLAAQDLKIDVQENRLVSVRVDGYNRGLMFKATYPAEASGPSAQEITTPALRLVIPGVTDLARRVTYADPSKPIRIDVEADYLRDGQKVVLDMPTKVDVGKDKENVITVAEELATFTSERTRRLTYVPGGGPNGGLLLRADALDLSKTVDFSGIVGPKQLRLRLVQVVPGKDDAKAAKEEPRTFTDTSNFVDDKTESVWTLVLDPTPPEILGLALAPIPPAKDSKVPPLPVPPTGKIYRGTHLRLAADGRDLESGIQKVIFFAGKPLPDNSIPPAAVIDTVTQVTKEKGKPDVYLSKEVVVPAALPGPYVVGVRFINGAGLSSDSEPVVLDVIDVPASATASKAIIAGRVLEGDRTQPKLPVALYNPAGALIASDVTDKDGKYKFTFDKLDPGVYRVGSAMAADNTRGFLKVPIATPTQQVLDADVKLYRGARP